MKLPLEIAAAAFALALGACEDPGDRREVAPLRIFAASSLTEAFEALAADFERAHPEVDVQVTFAGSQVLRLQIEQGAKADVFASANPDHMQALADAGLVEAPRTFAENGLVVIVPADDPGALRTFSDLPKASRVVLGTPGVPVGRYARRVLALAGPEFEAAVLRQVVSEESNVRLVRAKVELGEADAAIVYATDAAASSRVRVVRIPEALDVRARYPIAAIVGSEHAKAAARFIEFVRSDAGERVLSRFGFRARPADAR